MNKKIQSLERKIYSLKQELARERQAAKPKRVEDYSLKTLEGKRRLSQFFAGKQDLIVIHNMGRSCNYCSLWADTLTGYAKHLQQRAGLVLVSPDSPKKLAETAAKRGWKFPLATDPDGKFSGDMGFYREGDGYGPGVSAFHMNDDGKIVRTGTAWFGPGDDFCPIWPIFELMQGGAAGWEPK